MNTTPHFTKQFSFNKKYTKYRFVFTSKKTSNSQKSLAWNYLNAKVFRFLHGVVQGDQCCVLAAILNLKTALHKIYT